jgi:hypothetical protein
MNSKYREERYRPPFYLLTGIILGLIIGFTFSFFLFPIEYSNVPPETLQSVDKDQYRLMIAYAYHANHDIGRANARLGLLREDNVKEILLNQAQRSDRRTDAQILLSLYEVLQENSTIDSSNPLPSTQTNIPTLSGEVTLTVTPNISESITATIQTVKTATAKPTQPAQTKTVFPTQTIVSGATIPFRLVEQKKVCDPNSLESSIQIEVLDSKNKPMGNIRILVNWEGGQDIFFTGYFPEISVGYADFLMEPNVVYSVQIGEIGETVTQIISPECENDSGEKYWGNVSLLFGEP